MKKVTITLTYNQANILRQVLLNDIEYMKGTGDNSFKNFIEQEDRIDTNILKAIMKADGRLGK